MATLVFQAAGAVFGGLLGPFGAVAGRALGALAGNALDGMIFSGGQKVKGSHLSSARIGGAEEGAADLGDVVEEVGSPDGNAAGD